MIAEQYPLTDADKAEIRARDWTPPTDDELRGMGYRALDIEAIKEFSPVYRLALKPPPPPNRPVIRTPGTEPAAGGERRVVDVVIAAYPFLLGAIVLWLVVQVAT